MIQVSIIIPVYNVAPYIEKCLQSVANQTFLGGMECILVDDGSTDDSIRKAEAFITSYLGTNSHNPISFRILRHEKNRTQAAARNTGIKVAVGKWIYFLDSDDMMHPDCLSQMIGQAQLFSHAEAVFAGIQVSNGMHSYLSFKNKELPLYSEDRDWLQISILKRRVFGMCPVSKLVLREFLIRNELFFFEGIKLEDELWNMLLAQSLQRVAFVKDDLYYYIIREKSTTMGVSDEVHWQRLFILWKLMIKHIRGYRTLVQVKAICRFIIEETTNDSKPSFPKSRRVDLFWLFVSLACHSSLSNFIFILTQGFLALSYSTKYNNQKITKHIWL